MKLPPTTATSPEITAFIRPRMATSRARGAVHGPSSARSIRRTREATSFRLATSRMFDWDKSARSASVTASASAGSPARLLKSASTTRPCFSSTPALTNVAAGPSPSARMPMKPVVARPRAAKARTPPVIARGPGRRHARMTAGWLPTGSCAIHEPQTSTHDRRFVRDGLARDPITLTPVRPLPTAAS
jgi:hypothetical protein